MNPEYERIKFIFPSLDKFIIMDFNKKIALQDLKFTFTSVLKIDLFSKTPQFFISKGFHSIQLNSFQSLSGQTNQNFYQKDKNHLEIQVKFYEEGA
ncbi:unnamed protein product [Paramecium primaurelia]|uniref:Uncharacterized protein n=2 Tax=Paramecium TaxID=5884 RepID=A0A8S1XD30_9CILI|nr:unnamed protein product [Paramecium primaurelia]CAD8198839.1 unnamed protein product [Paramecium pentaurelia]